MDEKPTIAAEIYRSSRKDCTRQGLALDAAGIPYQIRQESGEFIIIVTASFASQARTEIDAYARENQASPSDQRTFLTQGSGWKGVFGYAGVLTLMFVLQHQNISNGGWFEAGKANAGLIHQGEWWRAVTALSLHSDLKHLISNIVFGGLIGLFAGQVLGSGLAWISIMIAGATGNLFNAWVRDPQHISIGASTAVFAAFGIVAAFASIRRQHLRASKFARYTPVVGAVILLSYLGTSGERTDVFAHIAGFLAGLLLGALLGKFGDKIAIGKRAQLFFGIGAVAFLGLAWLIALT